MAPSGPDGPSSRAARLTRHPWAGLWVPLLVLVVLLLADVLAGPAIRIGGLMVAVPALTAGYLGPGAVLLLVGVTLPFVVIASATNNTLDIANFPVSFATVVVIGVAAVITAAIRQRRERELAQARWVAAMAQRALLRPLPRRLGGLGISSLYLSADEEATVGGDIYACAALPGQARILVGDVQGKGLAAIEMAGYLLSAFRRAARRRVGLLELSGFLDRSLREDLTDPVDGDDEDRTLVASRRALEGFVTAVVVDYEEGDDVVRVANRGHPPPLLIHDHAVRRLDPGEPGLPLGLGDLEVVPQQVDVFELAVGDTLLLYTDGVTEARDGTGAFYPLAERLAGWTDHTPDALLAAVRGDLLRHAADRLGDDVALVAVHRTA
jgi:serine phosphatase RsbU (regulator of sigma subunit)